MGAVISLSLSKAPGKARSLWLCSVPPMPSAHLFLLCPRAGVKLDSRFITAACIGLL